MLGLPMLDRVVRFANAFKAITFWKLRSVTTQALPGRSSLTHGLAQTPSLQGGLLLAIRALIQHQNARSIIPNGSDMTHWRSTRAQTGVTLSSYP